VILLTPIRYKYPIAKSATARRPDIQTSRERRSSESKFWRPCRNNDARSDVLLAVSLTCVRGHHFLFFPRDVDGFAPEAPRDFDSLIFAGKEVACFKASLTHLSTAPWSALPIPLTANIPGIGRDGMKSQGRT
jgi:hypothetical protein